jgi:sugar lactone lactonase YvrE
MSRATRTFKAMITAALALALMIGTMAPANARPPDVKTIAEGLVGPLGLAVDRDGTVYVAEAFAGELTKIRKGAAPRTIYTAPPGEETLPGGIAVDRKGRVVFTRSIGASEPEPPAPPTPPTDTDLAKLRRDGTARSIASLLEHETENNPDQDNLYGFRGGLDEECLAELPEQFLRPQPYFGIVESNPFAVAVYHGGYLVADAAGNSILKVSRSGRIRTVAVLPPIRVQITAEIAEGAGLPECTVGEKFHAEPVPTDVEVGPDGYLYVTSLPGTPEAPGSGSVFRINPWNGKVRSIAKGFSGAVDLAVTKDGKIYVAELFANRISVVKHGRPRTFVELPSPGAVEIGRRGELYATAGVFAEPPETGSVVVISTSKHR